MNEEQEWLECEDCGVVAEDVSYRPNAFIQDVHNVPTAYHTVCDVCDYNNRMNI